MIAVDRDLDGIRTAALELFEENRADPESLERIARQSADPEAVRDAAQNRTLADGYYSWVEYLAILEADLGAGVFIPDSAMAAADLEGLAALRSARTEFDRRHPPCRRCGARLQNAWDKICGQCRGGK